MEPRASVPGHRVNHWTALAAPASEGQKRLRVGIWGVCWGHNESCSHPICAPGAQPNPWVPCAGDDSGQKSQVFSGVCSTLVAPKKALELPKHWQPPPSTPCWLNSASGGGTSTPGAPGATPSKFPAPSSGLCSPAKPPITRSAEVGTCRCQGCQQPLLPRPQASGSMPWTSQAGVLQLPSSPKHAGGT